ncbi:MAG: hypothetical protein LBN71_10780 [Tannerella sp.]|jgi:hypothetical protein|nr:hypothetical protein [Tannerella sp.]
MAVAYLTACKAKDGYPFYRTAIPHGIKIQRDVDWDAEIASFFAMTLCGTLYFHC